MTKICTLSAILLATQSALTCLTQSPTEPPPSIPVLQSTSTTVLVPALIRDASGAVVTSLNLANVHLTDNRAEQKIHAEPAGNQPLAIVVLMQIGGSAPREFQSYRTFNTLLNGLLGATPGLRIARTDHRIGLITFDSELREIWNFPPREEGLQHAFRHPDSGDPGAAILDALNFGVEMLNQQPGAFRRVLLLLSQPQDAGSKTSTEAVVRRLAKSNVTVYSLVLPAGPAAKKKATRQSRTNSPQEQPALSFEAATAAMKTSPAVQAALASGGESVSIRNREDLDRTLAVLAADFANTFLLSFHPTAPAPGFHSLQTIVDKKGSALQVAARSMYWADGDPVPSSSPRLP